MAAVAAPVLVVAGTVLHEPDEVPGQDAHRGMPDAPEARGVQQEGVAAAARIFGESAATADYVDRVAGQAAKIAHPLGEGPGSGVRVRRALEQQRVAAADADVFVVAVSLGRALVRVVSEETRQRVADTRRTAVPAEKARIAAHAAARLTLAAREGAVVHGVTEHLAHQATPAHAIQRTRRPRPPS
jgi:hypothetical protein